MDEEDMDKTIAVLESALEDLCLDSEPRPSKRLRTGEAKSSRYSTPGIQSQNIIHAAPSDVPFYLTGSEWFSLIPIHMGIAADDLVQKLGITRENFEHFRPLLKLRLKESHGRLWLREFAPHISREAAPLTIDKIKALIPPKGIWMSELWQKSKLSSHDLPDLMSIVRQAAVLKSSKIYLKDDPAVDVEEEVDDSDMYYTTVVYNSDNLSVAQARHEHANMQQCIDQLREQMRQKARANNQLHQRLNRLKLDQYSAIAQEKRKVYAGTLVECSTIRVKVIVRRSPREDDTATGTCEDDDDDKSESDVMEDLADCENENDGGADEEGVDGDDKDGDEERAEAEVDADESHSGELDDEDDDEDDAGDDETTIYVNAQLASTLSKLRNVMKPFLEYEVAIAMAKAMRQNEKNVQAILLEGDDSERGLLLEDLTSDASKQTYRDWYAQNATHSEDHAGGVEIIVYVQEADTEVESTS